MKEKRKDYELVLQQQIQFLKKSCAEFDKGDESEAIRIAGHLRTILHDSIQKKNFDSKLTSMIDEIRELVSVDEFQNSKKALNKLNGLKGKIEKAQKPQILSKSLLNQLHLKEKLKFIDTTLQKGSFSFYTGGHLMNTTIVSKSYFGLLAKEVITTDDSRQIVKYSPLCLNSLAGRYFQDCPLVGFDEWWYKEIFADGDNISFNRKDLITYVANHDGYAHVEENVHSKYQNFKEGNILENFINGYKKEKVNLATLNSVRQIAFEVLNTIEDLEYKH